MKVFLVGHSHAGSINRAAVAARADPSLARIQSCDFDFLSLKRDPFHGLLRDSRSQINDCGRALRERLLSADAVVLSLEGNWHNAIGQMERGQRFDLFGEAGESTPLEGRQIIPRSLMAQVFAGRMSSAMKATDGTLRSSFVEVLTFIREHARCPCVLVEPPPPVPDAEKIARFRVMAGAGEHGVTPFAIRGKLCACSARS